MPIRAVTFDCAQTLVKVDWRVDAFAVASAEATGVEIPPNGADEYRLLYYARLSQFLEANRRRDPEACTRFYADLCREWLGRLGLDPEQTPSIMKAADRLAFGPGSILFEPYPEAVGAVLAVRERGLKVAVLSNWDYSLHRVLDVFGFAPHLEFGLASLEEGVEKPDPRFFDLAVQRLGVEHDEVLHVGDSPLDDFEGAVGAGLRACLIDRNLEPRLPTRISSLDQVVEAVAWIG